MKRAGLALVLALAGCSRGPAAPTLVLSDVAAGTAETEDARRARYVGELEDDILSSYERDELPEIETDLIPHEIGPARFGVGPGDVLYGDEVRQRASSRWPLRIDPSTPTGARSKRLEIHLSLDGTAAWMSDEVSWRIAFCGHTAVIPLRVTALYAHDGDRWVEVFEHLSFARVPRPSPDGKLEGLQVASAIVDRSLADELSRKLNPVLAHQTARIAAGVSLDPEHRAERGMSRAAPTLLIAPDADGEWRGDEDVARAELVDGVLRAEDRRIGVVGRDLEHATVAYWVGNFVANLPARPGLPGGKVRLRGTFVFEKRDFQAPVRTWLGKTFRTMVGAPEPRGDVGPQACTSPSRTCRWVLVQGHVSEPIRDNDLAISVFGTALVSTNLETGEPLAVTCDDGTRATR